ncbi:MAG TPA: condensation domain-containing protein, partial [Microlunatus sp.]
GDSLTAVRFCALLASRTGAALTVADVFARSRYQDLTELVETHSTGPVPAEIAVPTPAAPAAPAAADPHVVPASPAQERLYAVCALQEGTTAYNLALAYRVVGPLDVDALRTVFARLVARHEQLRTSFHLDGGRLVQHIHASGDDVVSVLHLSAEQAAARRRVGPQPFDLSVAPLLRVEVVRISAQEHFLSLDLHHIVADQTSLALLSDEITAELQGRPVTSAPISYTDYVADLEQRARAGTHHQDVAFFAELLDGEIPRLELPTDRAPSGSPTHEGARHTFVSAAGRRAVADLARACGATPFMVHLTALTRLLSLYSGQRELVVGTAVSGRTMPGSERVVGMFAKTLPLRLNAAAERSVAEAVAAVRDDVLAVLAHQEAPLEAVLAQLGPAAGGPDQALFDVLINYVTVGTEDLELDGLRLEPQPPGPIMSRYALSFSIAERADGFEVDIEYRTELFDADTIGRLARQLDHLLVELTVDPSRQLRGLSLESAAEHARRRAELTAAGPEIDSSLLDRLRTALAEHADLAALSWDGREWTYAEVDRITENIAGGLQEAGVGVGDFVVSLVERDPWQVFCRLALLKCGAIEIPQDPQTPLPRIAHILADSGARVVLATDPGAHPWPPEVMAYRPDTLAGSYTPPADLTADSPSILIYTSGTTGQPKGTLVSHGGVLSTCADNGYMDYTPGQRIMGLTGSTFDPSLLDLYATLLSGATLVLGAQALNQDMAMLSTFLREERIDAGILITAVFHLLMAEDPTSLSTITALYVGGEAMQPWAARRAFDVLGPGRLHNLYGPTEASVCSTWYRVDEPPEGDRMPIGQPANNRELFIVHPDGTDVPRGVPGELCVAGPGVALGYHHRPDLTSQRFPAELGAIRRRLYRTGDRVVLDERGRIVYLDRTDRQIKHAGHRIE